MKRISFDLHPNPFTGGMYNSDIFRLIDSARQPIPETSRD